LRIRFGAGGKTIEYGVGCSDETERPAVQESDDGPSCPVTGVSSAN
jgi:hypothetical protein